VEHEGRKPGTRNDIRTQIGRFRHAIDGNESPYEFGKNTRTRLIREQLRRCPIAVSCGNCVNVVLGGLVVSVLAIESKVHVFKLGRKTWIFKGNNISQNAFFWSGKKLSVPRRKIYGMLQNPSKYEKYIS
jgi:hypothetical protein